MYRQPNSASIRTVRNTVGELIQFSMYTDRESENPLEADGPTIKFHQSLLGGQTVLDTLVNILMLYYIVRNSVDVMGRDGTGVHGRRYSYL